MTSTSSRRTFVKQAGLLLAAVHVDPWGRFDQTAKTEIVLATTATGKVRGRVVNGINVFKGIPYGGTTAGEHRFMPPTKPTPWRDTRDAFDWGPTAPQAGDEVTARAPGVPQSEDCLVLNVFTPGLTDGRRRPVLVWLHGGGFSSGSGSGSRTDGTNLARTGDAVVVTINHRLNVLGYTYLGEALGSEFSGSSAVGLLDIVAALTWVRDNIDRFGGDPNLVTIFGQSGGGRKVATLMAMPGAKGLYHRAIIQSGALLRLQPRADAVRYTSLLLGELGVKAGQLRELQLVPIARLLAANAAVLAKMPNRPPGWTANTPTLDDRLLPNEPWEPAAPALSANIPLVIGSTQTEETLYDRPTPEKLALDAAGLKQRVATRLQVDPDPVIAAYRKSYPEATPWDLHILIATDHPRGAYAREVAKRKAAQGGASSYLYRFDWETPEGGGHMRSQHAVDVPFVFNNISVAGPLISKRADAHTLAGTIATAWVAFARTGNPNTKELPNWPAYSPTARDTMLFNKDCRVEQDPQREARRAMERVLKLS